MCISKWLLIQWAFDRYNKCINVLNGWMNQYDFGRCILAQCPPQGRLFPTSWQFHNAIFSVNAQKVMNTSAYRILLLVLWGWDRLKVEVKPTQWYWTHITEMKVRLAATCTNFTWSCHVDMYWAELLQLTSFQTLSTPSPGPWGRFHARVGGPLNLPKAPKSWRLCVCKSEAYEQNTSKRRHEIPSYRSYSFFVEYTGMDFSTAVWSIVDGVNLVEFPSVSVQSGLGAGKRKDFSLCARPVRHRVELIIALIELIRFPPQSWACYWLKDKARKPLHFQAHWDLKWKPFFNAGSRAYLFGTCFQVSWPHYIPVTQTRWSLVRATFVSWVITFQCVCISFPQMITMATSDLREEKTNH